MLCSDRIDLLAYVEKVLLSPCVAKNSPCGLKQFEHAGRIRLFYRRNQMSSKNEHPAGPTGSPTPYHHAACKSFKSQAAVYGAEAQATALEETRRSITMEAARTWPSPITMGRRQLRFPRQQLAEPQQKSLHNTCRILSITHHPCYHQN